MCICRIIFKFDRKHVCSQGAIQFAMPSVSSFFFFNNSFMWLSSAGNSDKDDGDKLEGVHENTARSNSGYTVF